MSESAKPHYIKDYVIPLIAIVASSMAAYMSFATSQAQTELQNKVAELQVEQANKEFRLDVYIKSYDLVEKALEDENAPAAEFARRVISLVEDPEVQEGLYKYLENSVIKVKEKTSENDESREELEKVIARTQADQEILRAKIQSAQFDISNTASYPDLHGWRVQVMYCEREKNSLLTATEFAKTIASYTGAKSSLTSVKRKDESRVSNAPLNVNYSLRDEHEKLKAEGLVGFLNSLEITENDFKLRKVSTDFGNHMSIYVCI